MKGSVSRRLKLVTLALAGYASVVVFWLTVRPFGEFALTAFADINLLLGAALGGTSAWLAAARAHGRVRLGWSLLGVGLTTWALGQGTWTTYEVTLRRETPFPSLADAGYLGLYVPALCGILALASPGKTLSHARTAGDALAAALAIAAVVWHVVLRPIYTASDASPLEKALSGAYPLADLVLSFALLITLYNRRSGRAGIVLAAFTAGLGLFVAADLGFGYLTLQGTYQTGSVTDYGWFFGILLVTFAGVLQAEWQPDYDLGEIDQPAPWSQALPVVLMSALFALVFALGRSEELLKDMPFLVMVSVVVLLVLLRQALLLSDNVRLNRDLLRSHDQLARRAVQLTEQARHDPLTGALNHAAIVEELRRLVSAGDHALCAIAMIDVDGMKAINDTHGHQVGDDALCNVSRALQCRGAIVGRYGGDEFVVALPGCDQGEAEQYRREVAEDVAQTRLLDPETKAKVPLTLTIGFAFYPQESQAIVGLINLADSAMYAQRRQRPVAPDSRARRSPADDEVARRVGEIVPLLTSPGDIQTKLHFVAQRLLVSTGHDAVNAILFSPQPGGPALSSTVARVDEEIVRAYDEEQSREGEASAIRFLLEKMQRPFIMEDLANDERLTAAQRELFGRAGLRSGVVAPMTWQGQTLGALAVGSKQPAAFGPSDAQLLNAVAGQVTAVVRMSTLVDELQASSSHLEQAHEQTVMLLAAAGDAHDPVTGPHSRNVRGFVEALAGELGRSEDEARALGLAAALHDIGKLFVPKTVLTIAGPLDDTDWALMRRHTLHGEEFLSGHAGFELAATIARHHHERWDGTGYPDGLSGDQIPEPATIVCVADAFDAMTSERPYRKMLD